MEITLIKVPTGFAPADDEAMEAMKHFPLGSIGRLDVKLMRNYQFFKKWWALVKLGYDHWADCCQRQKYKGREILPNFDRFRKDITITAGFYQPVWNIKGEMRIEAESLAWSTMTEERFTQLYDATVSALLRNVFNGKNGLRWSEAEIRDVTDQVMRFAA
jgi:hypothetical protein